MTTIAKPRVTVFIATSLDGFIARKDGDINWLHEQAPLPDGDDAGFSALMARIDYLVMGRNTYETVLSFGEWPYSKPVIVMSQSLTEIPAQLQDRVSLSREAPSALLQRLTDEDCGEIYLDGGLLIQAWLREQLVSDLIITRLPVLLGEGRALFGALERDIKLQLISNKHWDNGFVQSHYRTSEL